MAENIKVNFMISEDSKKNIDLAKISEKMTASAIVDKLLKFDNESIDLLVSIYKHQNKNIINNYNYLTLSNGSALVFKEETVRKILDSDITSMSLAAAKDLGISNMMKKKENKDIDKDINQIKSAILYLNKRIEALEKIEKKED